MLAWAIGLFAVALVAGLLGFSSLAAGAAWIGQILFISFLAAAAFSLVSRLLEGKRT